MKRLALPLLLALLGCSAPPLSNPYATGEVRVIAHQGGEGLWPSNTVYAFERAVRMGVDMLELDVHLSRDGHLVVIHDDSVERTTGGKGKVKELTLAELKALDAGWYWPQRSKETDPHPFRGQGITIPTLEEVLRAFPGFPMTIEMKADGLAGPFCALLRQHRMTGRVIVASFRDSAMHDFREACPEVTTSLTESEIRPLVVLNLFLLGDFYTPPAGGTVLQIPTAAGGFDLTHPLLLGVIRRKGLAVQYWTVNEPQEMQRLIKAGAHGIITDRPDLLLQALGRQ
ncbi:Glycerophosphodiester phosphodiesterase [Calidithermus terrae]|uniref:Glycerophosphodiester phosphodiesterase n=1 Tax=Calidithermus terrae TaxID=1408545 RepID=A0A399ERZ7_9DEIN|nr:glycerophosphodiester phosphodiesterase [Calidithermus terrae]RIH86320.1 Glycerophosphodiester phosphodiesterase [Calidithermus terrae]